MSDSGTAVGNDWAYAAKDGYDTQCKLIGEGKLKRRKRVAKIQRWDGIFFLNYCVCTTVCWLHAPNVFFYGLN